MVRAAEEYQSEALVHQTMARVFLILERGRSYYKSIVFLLTQKVMYPLNSKENQPERLVLEQ